jgi:hypothetical protein
MFGLFKKKEGEIKVTEKIVISETAKLKALQAYWENDRNTVIVFWFDESLRQAEEFFRSQTTETIPLLTAREASSPILAGRTVVFGEHYPLLSKETALYEKLGISAVIIFSSLNEPLFKQFGADKIIQLMKQLGMKEDQLIEHNMITRSIRNAQEKIEKKVIVEQSAHSQKDWMDKNLPA